jgi:hypothetical protein
LGLLLVSKFSSIVAVPVYGLTLFIYALAKNNREDENNWKTRLANLGGYLLKGIAAFAVATAVIWCVYKVNTFDMPKETFSETIDFFFSAEDTNAKASMTNKGLHALNENDLTRPLGTYLFGPAWMFKRVSGGNGAYFMQQVGNGFTSYFPTVFVLKETIPFLILILFSLFFVSWQTVTSVVSSIRAKKIGENLMEFLRHSVVYYTMLIFIILYAYLSISGGLNIGFRHLFPILPFAYLLVTKKVFDFLRDKHLHSKSVITIVLAVLVVWQIGEAVFAYPSYTSYFNESIGGSKNGYRYVTDSNTDWGQDLNRLKIWIDDYNNTCINSSFPCSVADDGSLPTPYQPIDKIRVDYFGGGNPQIVLGDKYIGWWDGVRPVTAGWYAISENSLQGSIYDTAHKDPSNNYAWTLPLKPVAQIGKSILIYHVKTPPENQ